MITATQKLNIFQSVLTNLTNTDSEVQNISKTFSKTNKGVVLMLDDDTFLLDMYSKKLKNEGYEALTFNSAEDALEYLRSGNKTDLMLIDVIMPGINGLEFLQKVKEENLDSESIKIVLSNMGDQSDAIEKGDILGVTKYLVKAESTPSDVLGLVNRMLS
jgi:CheY-like chemotaxis protein